MGELDGEPFVAFDPDLSIRRAIDRFLRRHDVQVEVVLEFDNIENIKRAVEIPSGISILPEPSLVREVKAGTLVAIAIECDDPGERLTRPLAIVHRRQLEPRTRGGQVFGIADGQGCNGQTDGAGGARARQLVTVKSSRGLARHEWQALPANLNVRVLERPSLLNTHTKPIRHVKHS